MDPSPRFPYFRSVKGCSSSYDGQRGRDRANCQTRLRRHQPIPQVVTHRGSGQVASRSAALRAWWEPPVGAAGADIRLLSRGRPSSKFDPAAIPNYLGFRARSCPGGRISSRGPTKGALRTRRGCFGASAQLALFVAICLVVRGDGLKTAGKGLTAAR